MSHAPVIKQNRRRSCSHEACISLTRESLREKLLITCLKNVLSNKMFDTHYVRLAKKFRMMMQKNPNKLLANPILFVIKLNDNFQYDKFDNLITSPVK